ncbi:MAG: hypothetical protein PHD43_24045 [Methylococcales bacterium]|nr:hypothetical protein [Methylococcales bacterium]
MLVLTDVVELPEQVPLCRLILQSRSYTTQHTVTVLTIKQFINRLERVLLLCRQPQNGFFYPLDVLVKIL